MTSRISSTDRHPRDKTANRPLYRNKIKDKGILRLGDILTLRDYKLKSWDQMKKNGITNAEYFLLMGIYNAIPKD